MLPNISWNDVEWIYEGKKRRYQRLKETKTRMAEGPRFTIEFEVRPCLPYLPNAPMAFEPASDLHHGLNTEDRARDFVLLTYTFDKHSGWGIELSRGRVSRAADKQCAKDNTEMLIRLKILLSPFYVRRKWE